MNQGANFIKYNFSNGDNLRVPIQIWRERQSHHLKRWFFLKNRPIHFNCNSTGVIRLVKQTSLSFSSIEINKPLPAPVQVSSKFRSQLYLLPQIWCLTTLKACVRYFLSNFCFFHQMIALQKLWKMLFISSKKLFSFSRYPNICIFSSSFPLFADSKGQMEVE